MQKNLLLLLMVASCGIMYVTTATEKKDQKVPVINEEQHKRNTAAFQKSQKELQDEEEALYKKKEERDKLESELYSYVQRNAFVEKMVTELANNPGTIDKFKQDRKKENKDYNQKLKNDNNGISYTTFGGLTPPKKDSPVDIEYKLVDKKTGVLDGIDENLSKEHSVYVAIAEELILPKISDHLLGQAATFDNDTRAFGRCDYCRTTELEYKECLKKKRIAHISEKSIQESEDDIVEDAYNFMRAENIPITKDNIRHILGTNKITQGNFLKMRISKENLKKAIRGELSEQPKDKPNLNQEPQEKPNPLKDNPPKPNIVKEEN